MLCKWLPSRPRSQPRQGGNPARGTARQLQPLHGCPPLRLAPGDLGRSGSGLCWLGESLGLLLFADHYDFFLAAFLGRLCCWRRWCVYFEHLLCSRLPLGQRFFTRCKESVVLIFPCFFLVARRAAVCSFPVVFAAGRPPPFLGFGGGKQAALPKRWPAGLPAATQRGHLGGAVHPRALCSSVPHL